MKLALVLLVFILLAAAMVASIPAYAGIFPSEVLVVYNRQHQYSENVARYYAYIRGIPDRNLCGIDIPTTSETISTPLQYHSAQGDGLVDQIEQYLIDNFNPYPSDPDYYKANPSVDPIKAIVMCYGVPSRLSYGERFGAIDGAIPLLFQRTPWGNAPIRRYCGGGTSVSNPYYGKSADFTAFRLSSDNNSQSNPPMFGKIRFLSPSIAIASGTLGILYRGVLSNGQWSWSPLGDEDKHFIAYACSDMQVVDQQTAFLSTGLDQGGTILSSQDAGETWKPVILAQRLTGYVSGPRVASISFQRSGNGWIGWAVGDAIKRITSSDGSSWISTDLTSDLISNAAGKLGSSFAARGVAVADSFNVWICGNNGIYHSTDGGSNWTQQTTGVPANSTFSKVWMRWVTDHYEGIASGSQTVSGQTRACVVFTQDSGQTWQEQVANPAITGIMDDIAVYPAQDGSYKVIVKGNGPKGYLYDSNSGWSVFTDFPSDSASMSWTGGGDYLLCCQSRPCVQYGTSSGGAVTWTDTVQIPSMQWKLRYMVARLDALEDPLEAVSGFGTMPRDVRRMIDRAAAATPSGKFVMYGDPSQSADFIDQLEAAGISSGDIVCSTNIPSVVGQSDVMAYFGPHMSITSAAQYISWGRPGNTWHPGGVQFYNTNDGQSFRIPLHIWGMSEQMDNLTPNKLKVSGMWTGTVYTTHKVVLCNQPGGAPLSGGTALFQSDGTAELDLNNVTWPSGQGVYVEIRFPDNDQDPDLQGKFIPNARSSYWSASAIPSIISTGKRYTLALARDVTTQYIREGASGTIVAIDEPGFPCGSGPMLSYALGYSWGEVGLQNFGLGSIIAVLGDPLMAPFAVQPTVSFQSPTPSNGNRIRGQVTLSAVAAPEGTGNIDRVEFYAAGPDQNQRLIGTDRDAPYFFLWDTTDGFANGAYTIRAVAYQANTHVGIAVASRAVTLDNSANPTVSITWPETDNLVVNASTPVVATVSPSASRVQFWLSWNNSLILALEDNTSPYQCSITSAIVPDGAYRIQAIAFDDTTGTASYSSLRQLIVHNSGPLYYNIAEAAAQPDETSLMLVNKSVAAETSVTMKSSPSSSMNAFYVEEENRATGIRIETSIVDSMSTGRLLCIQGILHKSQNDLERYLEATDIWDMGATETPSALGMTNKSIGGAAPDGTPGIDGGVGLYNCGLLVKITGRVTYAGSDFIYIDDGSGLYDGNDLQNPMIAPIDGSNVIDPGIGVRGVRVYFADLSKPGIDDYVAVTGVSSIEQIGDNRVRLLRARSISDATYFDQYIRARAALDYMVSIPDLTPLSAGTKVRLVDHRVQWKGTINGYTSIWLQDASQQYPITVVVPGEPQVDVNDIVTVTGVILPDRSPSPTNFLQVDASEGHVYVGSSTYGAMSVPSGTSSSRATLSSVSSSNDDGLSGGGPFKPWPGPTAEEILASESFRLNYNQTGAIGWALSQPDGAIIDLPAEAISGEWYDGRVLGLREWFEPIPNGPRLFLYLDQPTKLETRFRDMATIDIIGGTLVTLSDSVRALVKPEAVYAYTDSSGQWMFPLPWPKFVGRSGIADGSENWPWKTKVAP